MSFKLSFFLLAACFASSLALTAYETAEKECKEDMKTNEDSLKHFLAHAEFLPGHDHRCYFHCLSKKTNIIDESGNMLKDKLKEMALANKASPELEVFSNDEVLELCAAGRSEGIPCDRVFEFVKCSFVKHAENKKKTEKKN